MIYKLLKIRIGEEKIKKVGILLGINASVICVGIINFLLNFSENIGILDMIMRIHYLLLGKRNLDIL